MDDSYQEAADLLRSPAEVDHMYPRKVNGESHLRTIRTRDNVAARRECRQRIIDFVNRKKAGDLNGGSKEAA